MRGRPWEYVFYLDFLRGRGEAAENALRHLGEVAEFVKVLGIYPAAGRKGSGEAKSSSEKFRQRDWGRSSAGRGASTAGPSRKSGRKQ
jgi:hypothetical protein